MKIKIGFLVLLLLCCSFISLGQKRITVSGTVVDAKLAPVEGATIFIDNVKTNAVTDKEGHYKVKVRADAEDILVFTLFYGAGETKINGRTSIDFILTDKSAEKEADDKKNAARELGMVDGQNPSFASYQSVYDMIRGRFAGVEVSGNSIKIMGSSSLNISTEPLFVVDGVIVNSIDDISPQDVKSIEVLKGPEASVYGMRGASGVIVITRLSGKD